MRNNYKTPPSIGVKQADKLIKIMSDFRENHTRVTLGQAVRHFLGTQSVLSKFRDFIAADKNTKFSLHSELRKTTDFHTFKNSVAAKKQMDFGAGILSPTEMERLRTRYSDFDAVMSRTISNDTY